MRERRSACALRSWASRRSSVSLSASAGMRRTQACSWASMSACVSGRTVAAAGALCCWCRVWRRAARVSLSFSRAEASSSSALAVLSWAAPSPALGRALRAASMRGATGAGTAAALPVPEPAVPSSTAVGAAGSAAEDAVVALPVTTPSSPATPVSAVWAAADAGCTPPATVRATAAATPHSQRTSGLPNEGAAEAAEAETTEAETEAADSGIIGRRDSCKGKRSPSRGTSMGAWKDAKSAQAFPRQGASVTASPSDAEGTGAGRASQRSASRTQKVAP